jgi:hypothetical protein
MNEGTPLGVKSTISRYGCSAVNGPHSGTLPFTTWRRVLLEKPTSSQIVKKLHFMETQDSLPHSKQPANCPSPEPDQSNPFPYIPLSEESF